MKIKRKKNSVLLLYATNLSFLAFWLCSRVDGCVFFENAVLNVVFSSVIYGPCLWMDLSLGPLRERAPWTSKEPRQLSSMLYSSAGLCWARRNLRADLVILPLWTHWNCVLTYCARQESIFIALQAKWSRFFVCLFIFFINYSAKSWSHFFSSTLIEGNTLSLEIQMLL